MWYYAIFDFFLQTHFLSYLNQKHENLQFIWILPLDALDQTWEMPQIGLIADTFVPCMVSSGECEDRL